MAASYDPKKFFWEPSGLTTEPVRFGKAANAVDSLVGIRSTERLEPTIKRNSIIVEKYYD